MEPGLRPIHTRAALFGKFSTFCSNAHSGGCLPVGHDRSLRCALAMISMAIPSS